MGRGNARGFGTLSAPLASVVLHDLVFDAVMVVEIEPLPRFVIVVFAGLKACLGDPAAHGVNVVYHHGDVV